MGATVLIIVGGQHVRNRLTTGDGEVSTSEEIKAMSLHVPVGGSLREVCPSCGGGRTKERSFSITRKVDGILYSCFRDQCQYRGFLNSKNNYALSGNFPPSELSNDSRPYKGNLYNLSERSVKYLCNEFTLNEKDLFGFKETDSEDIMIPMRDHLGLKYGYVNRRYNGLAGRARNPKSINYYDHKPEFNLHFPQPYSNKFTTAVIVEDIISSIRVSEFTYCVALMGTHLSEKESSFLYNLGIRRLIFYLDADANRTSKGLRDKYSLMFPECQSILQMQGTPDPKDLSHEELEQTLVEAQVI